MLVVVMVCVAAPPSLQPVKTYCIPVSTPTGVWAEIVWVLPTAQSKPTERVVSTAVPSTLMKPGP